MQTNENKFNNKKRKSTELSRDIFSCVWIIFPGLDSHLKRSTLHVQCVFLSSS